MNSFGIPVVRTSPDAFSPIQWDFEDEPDDDLGEDAADVTDDVAAAELGGDLDFGEVARHASLSPALFRGVQALDATGFALLQGPTSEQNQLIVAACRVLVDPALAAKTTLTGVVAREIGRAISVRPKVSARDRDRGTFVRTNAEASLREEGEALLYAATVRREIIAGGGPDVGLGGATGRALELVEKLGGTSTPDDAAVVELGAASLAPEHPNGRAHYETLWAKVYDRLMGGYG